MSLNNIENMKDKHKNFNGKDTRMSNHILSESLSKKNVLNNE